MGERRKEEGAMSTFNITAKEFKSEVVSLLARFYGVKPEEASKNQIYSATCICVRDLLTQARVNFKKKVREKNAKQVYYMSMEFLLGRSLRNHLFNMGITEQVAAAVKDLGVDIEELYEIEPDAGLGNGGLGKLGAAYMGALTSENYAASGFSLMYD